MYSCSKSESDGAKMEIKFRRHTFRLPSWIFQSTFLVSRNIVRDGGADSLA